MKFWTLVAGEAALSMHYNHHIRGIVFDITVLGYEKMRIFRAVNTG